MSRKALTRVRFDALLAPDSLSASGPASSSVAIMISMGTTHGRGQKKWQATEHLIERLTALALAKLRVEQHVEQMQLAAEEASLRAEKARLDTQIAFRTRHQQQETGSVDLELLERRNAAAVQALRVRYESIELRLSAVCEAKRSREGDDDASRCAVIGGALSLWAAYRVAYIQALPGPADAQRVGPTIPASLQQLQLANSHTAIAGNGSHLRGDSHEDH